jgi:hypothetical protein
MQVVHEPTIPAFSASSLRDGSGHLSVNSTSDLKIYEEHSTIINRLCDELGFKNPATAMA